MDVRGNGVTLDNTSQAELNKLLDLGRLLLPVLTAEELEMTKKLLGQKPGEYIDKQALSNSLDEIGNTHGS